MAVTTLADAKARFSEIVASAEARHERTTEETLAILSDPGLMDTVRARADEPSESIGKAEMLKRLDARQA